MGNNMQETVFGPNNPHPLSVTKTELVWEGKYDEYGNRREVDVAGLAMPMQRIETIDQPRSEAVAGGQLELFEKKAKRLDDFRNRLIWGDNKLVMASLLKEFKGKIDLIYIDPPFDVGADFTMRVDIGDGKDEVLKEQSSLEMVAYRDMWGKGADSYLHMMYESICLLRELLSETGSIFVHLDVHMGPYVKVLMDDVFGRENFQNEIAWYYYNKLHDSRKRLFPKAFDQILYYVKSKTAPYTYNALKEKRDQPVVKLKYKKVAGKIQNIIGTDGKVETYVSEDRTIDNVWRIRCLQPANKQEWVNYDTQKPVDLIERILAVASNEGDLILDVFCGSGSSLVAAERNNRRWIGCDLGRFAIHTTRKRLIEEQRNLHSEDKSYRAFDVHNLGRYERQWWQKEQLNNADNEHRRVVLEFFKAEILTSTPSPLLHGRKAGAFCHVDGIDSIFSREEAKTVAQAVQEAGGHECYCLAWEFEMDLRLTTTAIEQELGVKLKLVQIPREIMEKNRKNPPPFLEMAVLDAEVVIRKPDKKSDLPAVDVKLTKFLPSLAEVPSKELEDIKERAIKSGMDFIDFWAIDFDWHPDKPFNHHWQDYRTRKDRTLKTVSDAGHIYPCKRKYTICIKVVDIFGCDTSTTLEVKL